MAVDKDKDIASIRARLEEQSHLALRLLRREDPKWKYVQVKSNQYLNNLIGAPGKVWRFQRVKIPHRQGASHPTGNRALGLWR